MKSIWRADSTGKAAGMISVLAGAAAVILGISLCCSPEASAAVLYSEETAPAPEQQASQVNFQRNYTDGMEQAVITGYDGSGAALWTVQTASYPGTQLPNCCDVGIGNGKYYYVEGGTIITLDLRDGSRIWENPEFGGSTCCHVMDENGTLFICGYYGPDLFVVDKDGHTISKTEKFREGYNWPHQIELQDGILTIWYEQNGESLQVRVSDVAGTAAEASPAGDSVRLTPLSVTASSELEPYNSSVPPYDLYTYYASYIDDGSLSTAWNEGVAGDGTGEYLELAFPAGTVITGGVIWPGFYETEELFYQNNAPTLLEISSGGVSSVVEPGDSAAVWQPDFAGFSFTLDKEIVSDGTVRVTILGVRAGNTYDDTCISELYFTGREAAGQEASAGENRITEISGADIGDIVAFGKNTAASEAALYWQVLAKDESSLLLISRDVLSAPPYDDDNYYPVWSESAMRSWLNGEFYQNTFSDEEKAMIRDTAVTFATGMQEDGSWGQETVSDKVFLLNAGEAEMYFESDEARKAQPAEGTAGLEGIGDDGGASWWLDDIGFEQQGVAQVTAAGEIDSYGIGVNHLLGVRPAIRIGTGDTEPQQEAAGNDALEGAAENITENDMQRIFAEQVTEPVLYFLYDDYDYDGTYEAMIATEQPGGVYDHIWFMDSSGRISDLTGGREIYGYEFQDSANVRQRYLIDTGTQKFYVWENSAGGSGSLSYIFGVRGGVPYEPAISGTVQSFQKEGEEYVYYGNDFSNGFHEYPRIVLTYDAGSGEFS